MHVAVRLWLEWTIIIICCLLVTQSGLTLCDPMDYSLQNSSAHGISQARLLEWVAISFSRAPSQRRDWTCVSCIAGRFFTTEPQGKPIIQYVNIQHNFYEKSVSSDSVESDVFLDYFLIFITLLSTIYCIKCSWDAISICLANYILAI